MYFKLNKMVEIEKKIKDLLKQTKLIPLEDLNKLFENRKQKILSIFLDFIFKNNLEIYFRDKISIKEIIIKRIDNEDNYKSSLISDIQKYEKYSKMYESELLSAFNSFSNRLFFDVFNDHNYKFIIKQKVLGIKFLFNFKHSKECLTFIRQVSDLIYNDFSFLNWSVNLIYNYYQNIFRYSRRLMAYMFVDNIFRIKILKNLDKNIFYERLSAEENENNYSEVFLKLIYKNETENNEIIVNNKKNGINSGAIIQIDKIKYYIKTFHNLFKKKSSYESVDLKFGLATNSLTSERKLNELLINIP